MILEILLSFRTFRMKGQVGSFAELVATMVLLFGFITLAVLVAKYVLGFDIDIPFFP
jgi:hypothetical protein